MQGARIRRIVSTRVTGAAMVLLALGMLAGCAVPLPWVPAYSSSSSGVVSYPPPQPYFWKRVTPAPLTPQQAYVAGISQLRLCSNSPTTTTTTTWLVAGPTFGIVLARADCPNDPTGASVSFALLPLALDKSVQPRCPAWEIEGGSVGPLPPAGANMGQMAFQIPSWLPLPKDNYLPQPMGASDIVPSSLLLLESSTRLFVTGRYAGSATRPAGAETVSVAARSGWRTRESGMVTVTVPLAGGGTFFFSGTADATTIQNLASAALPHLDTLLPQPPPVPTYYPQPTPAC